MEKCLSAEKKSHYLLSHLQKGRDVVPLPRTWKKEIKSIFGFIPQK